MHYLAILDKAVGNYTFASDTCSDTAYTSVSFHIPEGRILHTETSDCTTDNTEDTSHAIDFNFCITDGMSATIVVTTEIIDFHTATIHVDVCSLEEVDAGRLIATITVFGHQLEVCFALDEEGVIPYALTRECKEGTRRFVGVSRSIVIHTETEAIEHWMSIVFAQRVHILVPRHTKSRLVIQQPRQLTATHF